MSVNLPTLAITEFDSLVKAEYQSSGFRLRDTIRTISNFRGDRVRFQVGNAGTANQKAIQDDVTPMNIAYRKVEAILESWVAPEFTDCAMM